MSDENKPQGDQPQPSGAQKPPTSPPTPNGRPNDDQSADAASDPAAQEGKKSLGALWRDLETSEKITAILSGATTFLALGSLAVAIVSCNNSVDNRQMANAIDQLTGIVSAQQDQVNGIANETAALDNEAEATNRAVNQFTREADAATNGAAASQGQLTEMKAEQRPWVGTLIGRVEDITRAPSEGGPRVIIDYVNYGRTPAARLISRAASFEVSFKDVWSDEGQKTFDDYVSNVCRLMRNDESSHVVFPGTIGATADTIIPEWHGAADLQKINSGEDVIVAAGCMSYLFGAQRHETGFCLFYDKRESEGLLRCRGGNFAS